jgi:hypothetical protein
MDLGQLGTEDERWSRDGELPPAEIEPGCKALAEVWLALLGN